MQLMMIQLEYPRIRAISSFNGNIVTLTARVVRTQRPGCINSYRDNYTGHYLRWRCLPDFCTVFICRVIFLVCPVCCFVTFFFLDAWYFELNC